MTDHASLIEFVRGFLQTSGVTLAELAAAIEALKIERRKEG